MSRVKPVTLEEARGEVKELYQSLEQKQGKVINIFLNMGNSAATLKAFLSINGAADHTSLPRKLREQIALVVGQTNHCQYCLSAHTTLAKGVGMNDNEIIKARKGESEDIKTQAILKFAKQIVENRGNVSNQDIASLKATGVNDTELVEVILVVIVNIFTNYFNLITDPQIDFPTTSPLT